MKNNQIIKTFFSRALSLLFLFIVSACGTDNTITEQGEGEAEGNNLKTVKYLPVADLFPNPERGFYRHTESFTPLSEITLRNYRKDNISLIIRVIYLKEFRNSPISADVLKQINDDLSTVRRAGLKAILRFAYSNSSDEPDAPLSTIIQHLDQLKPCFEKNKDVITVLQAGFIGAWGEWYYTTNDLNTKAARKAVLDKILEVLPKDRFVQVRAPGYKHDYIGNKKPLLAVDAFGDKAIARIGHHNDCFMAGIDDYGTYLDVIADKKYLNEEGVYVPLGGETCPPSGVDPADCSKAQSEMRNLRWSYLNQDYYRGVNDNWIVQGCMDDIIRDLGYRLALQKGEYSEKHAAGSELVANLSVKNLGYAPPFNSRGVELVLKSIDGADVYVAKLNEDPRTWQPYKLSKLTVKAALPKEIAAGDYKLYLFLPDSDVKLHDRPDYAIRLANKNCWDEATGYNDLGVTIKVDSSLDLPLSTSSTKFISK